MTASPPGWAEALLRTVLAPPDAETVSGDLLEEFRARVAGPRGRAHADAWYVRQVTGFVLRRVAPWAVVFGAAVLARTAFDWLAPPADFHARATASTVFGIGILLTAGFVASWRTGSFIAGGVSGAAVTALAAIVSTTGAAILLAIWHDPHTMAAIQASGGLAEVFELPVLMIVPGALLGTLGGVVGATVSRIYFGGGGGAFGL